MTKSERLLIRIDERTQRMDDVMFGKDGKDGMLDKHEVLAGRVLKIETSRKTWCYVIGLGFTVMTIITGIISASISFFKK